MLAKVRSSELTGDAVETKKLLRSVLKFQSQVGKIHSSGRISKKSCGW